MIERLDITTEDEEAIKYWNGGVGFKATLAANIIKQGWISKKQRKHLHSESFSRKKRNKGYSDDYEGYGQDGAPDTAGNGYVSGG